MAERKFGGPWKSAEVEHKVDGTEHPSETLPLARPTGDPEEREDIRWEREYHESLKKQAAACGGRSF